MPNKQAAIKELRKSRKRAAHNASIKKNVKALFKDAKSLVTEGKKEDAAAKMRAFQQAADKAAKRGVLHANSASRKKSRLMKKLAK